MDLLQMAAGFGLLKDLNSIWSSLDQTAQQKLDNVVVKAVEKFVPADNETIAPVRQHLLTTSVPFVERVSMAALHPATKAYFAERKEATNLVNGGARKVTSDEVPSDILVKCLNCGMSKSVHLHDDYDIAES
jgi:hypothetical protein